jgi:hypothetical protein
MDASPSIGDFWKVLLLRTETMNEIGQSKTGVWLSLRLFFLAGLIASIGLLAGGLAEAGQVTFSDQLSIAASSLATTASVLPQRWTPRLASAMNAAADRLQGASEAIVSVQPPLGQNASQSLRAIGAWASRPILALTSWMTVLLPVLLVARLMGGRGSLRRQVSLILLAFMPQALLFLSSFDLEPETAAATVATVLRVGAALWSLVLLVAALAIANGFGRGQAVKVLLATAAILLGGSALIALLVDRLAGPVLSLLL